MKKYDLAVIGAGIVGLTAAYTISKKNPGLKIILIEKEKNPGSHQSSRNSGVVHSGIYYKPGSLKAKNCFYGKRLLYDFCDKHEIPYRICGKVIVAVKESELPTLNSLHNRGLENKIECKLLNPNEIKEHEPYLKGISGIHIPSVAVIKFIEVVKKVSELLIDTGTEIISNAEVTAIRPADKGLIIETPQGEIMTKYLINTAGLHCDRIAKMATGSSPVKIIPFRGEYYELNEESRKYCNALIYPVPDPAYPFLGVHVTRMLDNVVECGPNAVLALAREGYKWNNINLKDIFETITFPGFLKFASKNLKTGIFEMARSLSKKIFLDSIQELIPEIQASDIKPGASGVRAQAMDLNGKLLDDFYIYKVKNQMHVLNAPSPAASSSFSIAETLAADYFASA